MNNLLNRLQIKILNFLEHQNLIEVDHLLFFECLKDPLPWVMISTCSLISIIAFFNYALIAVFFILLVLYAGLERSKQAINLEIENYLNELASDSYELKNFLRQVNCPFNIKNFDTREDLDWLNDLVAQFWPFINLNIQKEIDRHNFSDAQLQITLNKLIRIKKFTLGDKPPIMTSIEFKSDSKRTDEVVLDLKTLYFGNCLLSFSKTSAKVFKVTTGIKDIYFRANGRLILRPLLNFPPYIGGISFCFVEKPLFEYDALNLINIADYKLFRKFLVNLISNAFVTPNRFYFNFHNNPEVIKSLKFRIPIGLCYLQIIEAENLPRMRVNRIIIFQNSCHSYCKITIGDFHFKTSVVFNTCNPFWGDTYAAPVQDLYELFKVEIYDKDPVTMDEAIGSIEFKISDIADNCNFNGAEKWLPICKAATGELHFRIAYFKLTNKLDSLSQNIDKLSRSLSKFPIAIISIYIHGFTFNKNFKNFQLNPMIHLKCSGKIFQMVPLSQTGIRHFIVEETCHFTTNDPLIEVINITIINLRQSSVVNLSKTILINLNKHQIIGTCAISIKELFEECNGSTLLIDREFELSKNLKAETVEGKIRLCICLNLCEIENYIFDNINQPINVKSSIEPTTSETSFFSKIIQNPGMAIIKPIQTIKLLPSLFTKKKFNTFNDSFPFPSTSDTTCQIKLRFNWRERTCIQMDIFRLVNLPSIFLNEKYKYNLSIKLELLPKSKLIKSQTKQCSKSHHTGFKKTGKIKIIKGKEWVNFNQKISFKLCPNHFIDDFVFNLSVNIHMTKAFCFHKTFKTEAVSGTIRIPSMGFRRDFVEGWFLLKGKISA